MFTPKCYFFQLPDNKASADLFTAIEKKFTVELNGSWETVEQLFDSFDWRLFRKNLYFVSNDNCTQLIDTNGQIILETDPAYAEKYFWWSFPSRSFREYLQPILEHRAISPLVGVEKIQNDYRLINKDTKVVSNLSLIVYKSMADGEDQQRTSFIRLRGIRGYDAAFNSVSKIIRHHGGKRDGFGLTVFTGVMRNSHRIPLDYSSKYSVVLEKEWPVGRVSSVICLDLLKTMEWNVEHIIADIDSEFLHDFRVAIRRTRSYLSLMKKLLPEQTAHFMAEFKWLGSLTGPVRDLDVYLLMKDHYSAILPKTLAEGLSCFFIDLERRRKQAFVEMVEGLSSDRFNKLMLDWRRLLNDLPVMTDDNGLNKTCRPEAVKRIYKRFAKIQKDGKRIDNNSADERLHELRIQGKKFRYLLEFFTSYFQQSDVKRFVKQLKKLQNNLGDFNDLSVQQHMLAGYHSRLAGRSKRDVEIAAALGGLLTHLAGEQQLVRKNFKRTFKRFTKKENIRLFEQTFQL